MKSQTQMVAQFIPFIHLTLERPVTIKDWESRKPQTRQILKSNSEVLDLLSMDAWEIRIG